MDVQRATRSRMRLTQQAPAMRQVAELKSGNLFISNFEVSTPDATDTNTVRPGDPVEVNATVSNGAASIYFDPHKCDDSANGNPGYQTELTVAPDWSYSELEPMCIGMAVVGTRDREFTYTFDAPSEEGNYDIESFLTLHDPHEESTHDVVTIEVRKEDSGGGGDPGGCSGDWECQDGYVCENGECVPDSGGGSDGCSYNFQCQDGYVCENGECVPEGGSGECQYNADCPQGHECQNGSCVQISDPGGCLTNADCPEGYACDNGECVPQDNTGDDGMLQLLLLGGGSILFFFFLLVVGAE